MPVIYKYSVTYQYPASINGVELVTMPRGAKILSAALQQDMICIWALVDTDQPDTIRKISYHPTGLQLHKITGVFIGTVLVDDGELVFHLFDNGEA